MKSLNLAWSVAMMAITFSGSSAQAQVTVEADFQTVTRELNRPPLPGLNLFTLGTVGALRERDNNTFLFSGDAFTSAAAFAAVSDAPRRPRVRVNAPLERILYDRGELNELGDEIIDFGQGLLPIQHAPVAPTESYDDAVGMDDFLQTLERLGLDVYMTIESVPRQRNHLDDQCYLASDPGAITGLYPNGSAISWNISPPRDYAEWSLLLKRLTEAHPNVKWWAIGNEPNSSWFWSGTKEEFFVFYDRTAEGLALGAGPNVQIGGYGDIFVENQWISDFLLRQPKPSRLDFLSFHRYATNPSDLTAAYHTVRQVLNASGYPGVPVVLEEFGEGWQPPQYDTSGSQQQAAYVAASLIDLYNAGLDDAYYFDYFNWDTNRNDFVRFTRTSTGNMSPDTEFSAFNISALTPTHQVFQVFDHLSQTVIQTASNQPNVHVLATKSEEGSVALVLSNFGAATESVDVTIANVPRGTYDVSEYLIDTPITLGNGVVFSAPWDLEAGVGNIRRLGRIQPRSREPLLISRDFVTTGNLPSNTVALFVLTPTNVFPIANAGADQTVLQDRPEGAAVTLDGSASFDPDRDPLTYTWREGGVILAGPTPEQPTVNVVLPPGTHVIELEVDDGRGGTATDTVEITVLPWLLPATVDIDPDTLNLSSKGRSITCYIELEEDLALLIDERTVLLSDINEVPLGGASLPILEPSAVGDYDGDNVPDLMVKFDRQALIALLRARGALGATELTVTGELVDGTPFEGSDVIRVTDPGGKKK